MTHQYVPLAKPTPFVRLTVLVWSIAVILSLTVLAQPSVDSVTLINTDSDEPVVGFDPIADGAVVDLKLVGTNLNVRANTTPDSDFGSVRFELTGASELSRLENVPVWAMAGNSGDNYTRYNFSLGEHTLTVTPYDEDGGGGIVGTVLTIGFKVVNGAPQIPSFTLQPADQTVGDGSQAEFMVGASGTSPLAYQWLFEELILADGGKFSGAQSPNLQLSDAQSGDQGGFRCIVTNLYGAATSQVATLTVYATNYPPSVAITEPVAGAAFLAPASFALEAAAEDSDGEIAQVEFFSNGSSLGVDQTRPFRMPVLDLPAGVYSFTAVATDNEGASVTSSEVPITVIGQVTHGVVSGELKKWHRVTVTFAGPPTAENADPNPFRDLRLDVQFTHQDSGKAYLVPGFYAADGDAAETSATSGDLWQVRFAPDEVGTWLYVASFRVGSDVAASDDPAAGSPGNIDGASGSFVVGPSDKTGRDLRAKGRLEYVGQHHLRFAETGEWFLKCGADAPENLLNYADFDDVPNVGNRQKTWSPHAVDYDPVDAGAYVWQGGKGANLLGAIRYLSGEGMNVFSFLTFNVDGDDDNIFPHLLNGTVQDFEDAPNNARWANEAVHHDRFDVSRLEQWERIFSYGDQQGMYLHFKTQETENEMLMDDGDTLLERRLYYRELIARYGHHLALNWNLGEENGALGSVNQDTAQRQAMAQYFYDHDPYHHLIVIHNGREPDDLLGDASRLTGYSLQTSRTNFSQVHSRTRTWIERSAAAGKPWVVACDEPGDASHALVPDSDVPEYDPERNNARQNALWGQLMAGGAGLEFYFGYQHDHSDLTCEDWRSRDLFWDQCRYALEFFRDNAVPFWEMSNADSLTSAADGYCLSQPGEVYVVFLKTAATTTLNLNGATGKFGVGWFDPRNGGPLQAGTVSQVTGGGPANLGAPPRGSTGDWVALIRLVPAAAPTLDILRTGEEIELNWDDPRFSLQHAPDPSGLWTDVPSPAASPYPVQPMGERRFFRLSRPQL